MVFDASLDSERTFRGFSAQNCQKIGSLKTYQLLLCSSTNNESKLGFVTTTGMPGKMSRAFEGTIEWREVVWQVH